MSAKTIKIVKPDDFHCHLRRGDILKAVVGLTAREFGRALIMPNTVPAISTAEEAEDYRREIMSALPAGTAFKPIMAIMLTKRTTPQIVREAGRAGVRVVKLIPEGVSTNSEESIALDKLSGSYSILDAAREAGMIFSGHWELLHDPELPPLNREARAIPFLHDVIRRFPGLKIIVEHASTEEMLGYVEHCPANVAATLTVHHARITYRDACDKDGKVHSPHNYCKPIAKTPEDVAAVRRAMTSGNPKYFFGSDSAPHLKGAKEKILPAAGIFNPFALCWLCRIFEESDSLGLLNNFVSKFGANFYGLPQNRETIELVETPWIIPAECSGIVPFRAGETLRWQIAA